MRFTNKLGYILFVVLSLILLVSCDNQKVEEQPRVVVPGGLIVPYGNIARLVAPHDSVSVSMSPYRLPDENWQVRGEPDAQLLGILPQGRRLVITSPEPQQQTTRYLMHVETTRGDLYQMVVFILDPGFEQAQEKADGKDKEDITSEGKGDGDGENPDLTIEQIAEAVGLPANLATAAIESGMSTQEFIDFIQDMQRMGGDDTLTDSRTIDRVASGKAESVLADQARGFFDIPEGVLNKNADAQSIAWLGHTIVELGGDPSDRSWYDDFGGTVRDHLDVPQDATKDMDVHDILEGMTILQQTGSDINDPGAWETLIEGQRQGKSDQEIAKSLLERNENGAIGTPGVGVFVGGSSSTTGTGSERNDRNADNNAPPSGSTSSDSDNERPDSSDFGGDDSSDSSNDEPFEWVGAEAVVLQESAAWVYYISGDGTTWIVDKNTGEVVARDSNLNIIDPPPDIPGVSDDDDDSSNDSDNGSNDDSDDDNDDNDDDSDDDIDDDDDSDDDSDNGDDDSDDDSDNGDDDDSDDNGEDTWPVADWYPSTVPVCRIIAMGEMQLERVTWVNPDYEGSQGATGGTGPGFGVIDPDPDYEGSRGAIGGHGPGFGVIDFNPDYEGSRGAIGGHAPGSDIIDLADPDAGSSSGGGGTHLGGTGEGVFLCVGELAICLDFSEFRCCPATNDNIDVANTYVSEHEGQQMVYWNYGGENLVCLEDQWVPAYQSVCNQDQY